MGEISRRTALKAAGLAGMGLLAGCNSPSPMNPTTSSTGTPTASSPATATPIPPAATHVPSTETLTPDVPLAEDGPWFVFSTTNSDRLNKLWAVNADGSGLTQLTGDTYITTGYDLKTAISPASGHVVFVSQSSLRAYDPTLHLLWLPNGEDTIITRLMAPDAALGAGGIQDPFMWAIAAVEAEGGLAWSPDGAQLAFIGAQDGPTADLYVYSVGDGSITRLSSGASQACGPTWSLDGQYIVHGGAGTVDLGGQGNLNSTGVWAARADGSGIIDLYQPHSTGETFSGWTGPHTFLVYSQMPDSGPGNLRTFNIDTGQSISIWPDPLFPDGANGPGIFAWDPDGGTVLILVDHLNSSASLREGMYLTDVNGTSPRFLDNRVGYPVWMPELGAFFVEAADGVIRISPTGEVETGGLPDLGRYVSPLMHVRDLAWSPDGTWWAWPGSAGLWIGPIGEDAPMQVSDQVVKYATWSPDGQNVLFFTHSALYVVGRTGGQPALLSNRLLFNTYYGAGWVMSAAR